MKKNIIISIFSLLFLFPIVVFSQTLIPQGTDNWLSGAGTPGSGDVDGLNVVFFEIPDTVTGPIYFAIEDPGIVEDGGTPGTALNPQDQWIIDAGERMTFTLVGGDGAFSNPVSRKYKYSTKADVYSSGTGIQLDQHIYTPDAVAGALNPETTGWIYFNPVYPSQGEHIGNKYYFKVIAEASTGANFKNGYRFDASLSNAGSPTGISGGEAFAYSWCVLFRDDIDDSWDLYPYVTRNAVPPVVRFIVVGCFDFDPSGGVPTAAIYNKEPEGVPSAITVDGPSNEVDNGSVQITAGEDNGTWRVRITETGSVGYPNTSEVWAWENGAAENGNTVPDESTDTMYRIYSGSYNPPDPHHIVAVAEDGTAIDNDSDTEKITFQVVDDSGTPLPYSEKIWIDLSSDTGVTIVQKNNNADIDSPTAVGANTTLVTTDVSGIGWITIKRTDQADSTVTVTPVTNGGNSSSTLPGTNTSADVFFGNISAPTISSAGNNDENISQSGTPLENIVITETGTGATRSLVSGANIRIKLPSVLTDSVFSAPVPIATPSGGGFAGVVTIAGNVITVPITGNFANGDTLTLSGITANTGTVTGSGKIILDYDGSLSYLVEDDKATSVKNPNLKEWLGSAGTGWNTPGNWSGGSIPVAGQDVVIRNVLNQPVLDIATTPALTSLTIDSGSTLSLNGNTLQATTFENQGTLKVSGGETVTNFTLDTDSGTVEYSGTGNTIAAWGNYYDLVISGGTRTLSGAVVLGGSLTISTGGTLNSSNQGITLAGNWNNSGTFVNTTSETVTFQNNSVNSIISGSTSFYNLAVPSAAAGKTILFEDGSTQTVRNDISINGTSGNEIILKSTNPGTQWTIQNDTSTQNISYINVTDSNVTGSGGDLLASSSTNGGNNDTGASPAWNFNPVFTWTGGGGASWNTPGSWDLNTVPVSGSTVVIPDVGTDPVLAGAVTVNNLTIQNLGILSLNGNNLTVSNTFDIQNNGTLRLIGSEASVSVIDTNNGTIEYIGGAAGQNSYTGLPTAASPHNHLIFNDTTDGDDIWALGAALNIGGNLTVTTGSFDLDGNNLATVTGTFLVDTNGQLTLIGNETVAVINTNNGTINYKGAAGVNNYPSLPTAASPHNHVIFNDIADGNDTWTLGAGLNIGGNLTLSSGTLSSGAFNLNITGNSAVAGTLTSGAGNVAVGGNLSGAGTLNGGAGNIDVDGTFIVGTYSATSGTTFAGGNYNVGSLTPNGGLIVFDNTAGSTVIGEVFNNVQISANTTMTGGWTTATLTIDAGSTLTSNDNSIGSAAIVCNGTLQGVGQTGASTITASGNLSGTGTLNGGAGNIDVDGTFIVGTYSATSGTTFAGGNYDVNLLTHNNGIFDFDTTGGATIAANGQSFNTVYVSADKTMTEALTASLVSIDDGATLTTGNNILTVTGNVVDTGTTGTLVMGNVNCDIDGNLTVNTVTASSATTFVGGNYDVGSLTPNGGLIVFDNTAGSTVIGEVFNNVQISANTTMTGGWTTATLTIDAGSTLTSNDNSIGSAAIVCNGTLQGVGQTGASTITASGNLSGTGTLNGGAGNIDVDGTFIVGTYSATSGTTFAGGNYDVNLLTHNNGIFDFDTTGGANIAANGQSFNTVYVSADKTMTEALTASLVSIDDGATLTTGNNILTVTGNVVDTGTTGTLVMGNVNCDIDGNLTVNTVTASSATTFVGGNYDVGSLTPNGGLIVFDNTAGSTVIGEVFNNVQISANTTMTGGWTTATLTIDAGSTLTSNDNSIGSAAIVCNGTLQGVGQTGASTITASGNLSGTGTLNGGAGNIDVDGTFIVGTYSATSGTTFAGGNYDVNLLTHNNGIFDFDTTGGATIAANGQSFNTVYVSADKTMTEALTASLVSIDDGVTLTTGNNILTVTGNVVDTGTTGTLVMGNVNCDIDGNLTVNTVTASSATTFVGGNYDVGSLTPNGGLIVFDNTAGSTVIGEVFNNVQISANTTMTGGWTTATLTIDAGSTLTSNDNSIGSAAIVCNGTLQGVGQTGASTITASGNLSGTGTLNGGAGNIDVDGTFIVGTYSATSGTTFAGGNYNVGSLIPNGGLIVFDNTAGSTVIGEVFNNVQISANTTMTGGWTTATLTIDAGSTLTSNDNSIGSAAIVCNGTLQGVGQTGASTITASGNLSGTGTLNGGAGNIDVDGTFIVGTYSATSGTTFAGGNYDVNLLTHNNGIFDFDTTGGATIAANGQSFNTVYVSADKTMTEALTASLVSIDDGATLTTGNNILTVTGNVVDTGTTGTLVMGNVNCDIDGNLTVNTVTASSATTFVGGNYDVGSLTPNGGLIVFDNTAGSTVIGEVFNNVQISANTTMTGGWTTATLTIDAGSTLTSNDNSIGSAAIVCNGTLQGVGQTGASTITASGNLSGTGTLNGGAGNIDVDGTFIVGTYSATSGTTFAGGNYNVGALTPNGGLIVFDNTAGSTVIGEVFNNVQISANTTMTGGWTTATLTIDAGSTLTSNDNSIGSAAIVCNGSLNATGQISGANSVSVTGNLSGTGTFQAGNNGTVSVDVDIDGDVSITNFQASAGETDIGGSFTSINYTHNNGFIVFNGTGIHSINIDEDFRDIYIDANGATINLNNNITCRQFVFYRGTLNVGNNTIATTSGGNGDFIAFGPSYSANDQDRNTTTPGNTFFAYPAAGGFLYYPAAGTYNAGTGAFSSATTAVFGLNAGSVITTGSNFYNNGANMNGGGNWTLNVLANSSSNPVANGPWGSPYAVAFNMSVANCNTVTGGNISASLNIAAGDRNNFVTDGGGNQLYNPIGPVVGWDFTRPSIVSAETVMDNIIRITFNEPIENSSNEISAVVAQIQTADDTVAFTNTFIDNDGTPDLPPFNFTTTNGEGDLTTFYLEVNTGETWKTDARGALAAGAVNGGAGDANSTDRSGAAPVRVPNIDMLKGVFFDAGGHNMVKNYGENGEALFNTTTDECKPVLYRIDIDRQAHAKPITHLADGHNLFRLYYSEPVHIGTDIGDGTDCAAGFSIAAANAANQKSGATFAAAGEYGGALSIAAGTVSAEGYFSYGGGAATLNKGFRYGDVNNEAVYRPNSHQLEIYLSGWNQYASVAASNAVDSLVPPYNVNDLQWPGLHWGVSDPKTADASLSVTANSRITDADGNSLDESVIPFDFNNLPATGFTVNNDWDIDEPKISLYKPGMTHIFPLPGFPATEVYVLDNDSNDVIDRLEFHIHDNSSDEGIDGAGWNSSADHPDQDLFYDTGAPADILPEGVRDFTVKLAMSSFFINRSGTAPVYPASGYTFSTEVSNTIFEPLPGPVERTAGTTASDMYFTLSLVNEADLGLTYLDQVRLTYDEVNGSITDLAGNRLTGLINVFCIEQVPPVISYSLASTGGRKIFVRFSKYIYGPGGSGNQVTAAAFQVSGTPVTLEPVIQAGDQGILEAFLVMPATLSAELVFTGVIQPQLNQIFDSTNTVQMATTSTHKISDIGIRVIEPVWADDGVESETIQGGGALKVFDGTGRLHDSDITLQAGIQSASAVSLPSILYFDVNPPSSAMWNDFWLPGVIKGFNENPNNSVRGVSAYSSQGALRNFIIPSNDSEIKPGATLEFLLRLGGLYCSDVRDPDDPRTLIPWKVKITGVKKQRAGVTILNNVINPLEGEKTVLQYDLEKSGAVTINIFSLSGDVVKTLFKGRQAKGSYSFTWDGKNTGGRAVARGIYFIRIVGPDVDEYRKVMVVK